MREVYNLWKRLQDESGEHDVMNVLSGFSCSQNKDIEDFVHRKAIDMALRMSTNTFLLMDTTAHELMGIVAVTIKTYVLDNSAISKTAYRKLSQHYLPSDDGTMLIPCFLIAQLAKNDNYSKKYDGALLIETAEACFDTVRELVGGKVIVVECEADAPKLIAFYERNGFVKFGIRKTTKNEQLLQMLKIMH